MSLWLLLLIHIYIGTVTMRKLKSEYRNKFAIPLSNSHEMSAWKCPYQMPYQYNVMWFLKRYTQIWFTSGNESLESGIHMAKYNLHLIRLVWFFLGNKWS